MIEKLNLKDVYNNIKNKLCSHVYTLDYELPFQDENGIRYGVFHCTRCGKETVSEINVFKN